jgi:hypothetical protein
VDGVPRGWEIKNVAANFKFLENLSGGLMSAPSRRPEIRRRRTRKEKIVQLRKRLAAAKTDADKTRITAKLHKLAILSPGQPLLK